MKRCCRIRSPRPNSAPPGSGSGADLHRRGSCWPLPPANPQCLMPQDGSSRIRNAALADASSCQGLLFRGTAPGWSCLPQRKQNSYSRRQSRVTRATAPTHAFPCASSMQLSSSYAEGMRNTGLMHLPEIMSAIASSICLKS
jgi:hypothetical protein